MTVTSVLGLTTYDVASGSSTTFSTFRSAIAGQSSNMTILDGWAGGVSGSLAFAKQGAFTTVNANLISGNYFEASNGNITSYLTNMPINLRLSNTITGSPTLNINGYGIKALKKVDTSGSLIDYNSGELILNNYYSFIYNGTYFVAINTGTSASSTYSGSGVTNISGSGVMSSSTGSVVIHNVSGITTGSYNQIIVDKYGHITAGSFINITAGSSGGSGSFATSGSVTDRHIVIYSGTSGSIVRDGNASIDTNGNLNMNNCQIINYAENVVTNSGSVTYNVDWSSGNLFEITMTGNRTLTFSNLLPGRSISIMTIQDSTGSRIITWPSIKWTGGSPMVLSTAANAVDVASFFVRSGGSTVYGFPAGLDMK